MQKLKVLTISIIVIMLLSLAGISYGVSAHPLAASSPSLGDAESFSVLAALSMSSANTTKVSGNLGLSPGLAVSRTGPWIVGGKEYFGPTSLAATAQKDALAAFNNLAGQTSSGAWNGNASPGPGVWTDANTTFAGTLTLSGDYNDVWVFQVGSDLTFTGSVVMAGDAQPCHVFWQIGRDATIASGTTFAGTLIASRDITVVSGATVNGRVISLHSSLTTDANTISGPSCAAAPIASPTVGPTAGPTASPTTGPTASPTVELTAGPTASPTTGPTAGPTARPTARPTSPPNILSLTATSLPGLPPSGGAPIQNEDFPWSLLIIGGFSSIALVLGVRAYRRTYRPKQ